MAGRARAAARGRQQRPPSPAAAGRAVEPPARARPAAVTGSRYRHRPLRRSGRSLPAAGTRPPAPPAEGRAGERCAAGGSRPAALPVRRHSSGQVGEDFLLHLSAKAEVQAKAAQLSISEESRKAVFPMLGTPPLLLPSHSPSLSFFFNTPKMMHAGSQTYFP